MIRSNLKALLDANKIEMPSLIELRNAKVCLIKEIHGREKWLIDRKQFVGECQSDFDALYDSDVDILEKYNMNLCDMQNVVMKENFGIQRHYR